MRTKVNSELKIFCIIIIVISLVSIYDFNSRNVTNDIFMKILKYHVKITIYWMIPEG